ncbi:DNA-directed RNA polymerase subunit alpha C-terminal domain-containing protein [Caballeronia cordobensis]|uniref:DNA-directed RNA polymerase subunit alpha C-terminal domain-containing protein n=1 Tax=Caballeronia cordobensis TaxID=1353886 RepID=UPI00045F0A48|nr:hypothetical protein BRPE67_BCDS11410 [Burkholderia sp. RPE67]
MTSEKRNYARPTRASLHLSKRVCTALDRAGLRTVDQIVTRSPRALLRSAGLGHRSVLEIEVALALFGLTLSSTEDEPNEQDR